MESAVIEDKTYDDIISTDGNHAAHGNHVVNSVALFNPWAD